MLDSSGVSQNRQFSFYEASQNSERMFSDRSSSALQIPHYASDKIDDDGDSDDSSMCAVDLDDMLRPNIRIKGAPKPEDSD